MLAAAKQVLLVLLLNKVAHGHALTATLSCINTRLREQSRQSRQTVCTLHSGGPWSCPAQRNSNTEAQFASDRNLLLTHTRLDTLPMQYVHGITSTLVRTACSLSHCCRQPAVHDTTPNPAFPCRCIFVHC